MLVIEAGTEKRTQNQSSYQSESSFSLGGDGNIVARLVCILNALPKIIFTGCEFQYAVANGSHVQAETADVCFQLKQVVTGTHYFISPLRV